MSDLLTGLTDEDIRTDLLASEPRAAADDDGTDGDDDGTDGGDDDGTDGGDADGTDA